MRAWVVILVIVVLTTPIWSDPLSSQGSADDTLSPHADALPIIYEVCPGKPEEFVTIMNSGQSDLNASRLKVTDGEGTLTLPSLILRPGDSITLFKNASGFEPLRSAKVLIPYTHPGVLRKGSFTLADDGDQVMLLLDGVLADSFCYGTAAPAAGWTGEPFQFPDKGHLAKHLYPEKGRNAEGWSSSSYGRTDSAPFTVVADVIPVIHPDDGSLPLLELIHRSSRSIVLSVYTLDDPDIAFALAEASGRGVDVDVLIEGQPVGGLSAYGKRAIVTMLDSGTDVRIFKSNDSYRRYEYIHAKYAIFDSKHVSISSENWGGGLSENRGWGAIIDSEELAARLYDIFLEDSSMSYGDVQAATRYQVDPFTWGNSVPDGYELRGSERAEMSIIVSPDCSTEAIRELIKGARERIFIEEMSMDMDWMESSGLLSDLLDAARSGVEVKVLLDRANQYEENLASATDLMDAAAGLPVECKLASSYHDFTTIHNKGMIVDDSVLFSSINLVTYAFNENREMGVIVDSSEISDMMKDVFMGDWLDDSVLPTIVLPNLPSECEEGKAMMIDASGSHDNSGIVNYSWDVDGDGSIDGYGPIFCWNPSEGERTIVLTVSDGYGNSAMENITISVKTNNGFPLSDMLLGAPVIAIGSVLAIRGFRKRIKSNK